MAELTQYKTEFVDFMLESGVLKFGQFTTKSGRESPYFINTGLYSTGEQIRRLGGFYADAILDQFGTSFDVLFGPAYKGIPLVVSTAAALAERDHNVSYCFNRKEAKDHGEGGVLVGHQLGDNDRVVIVEDITTAGTAIREVVPVLKNQANVSLAGLIVSVDRCERGPDGRSALSELADEFSMPTQAIVTVYDIISRIDDADQIELVREYLDKYGAR